MQLFEPGVQEVNAWCIYRVSKSVDLTLLGSSIPALVYMLCDLSEDYVQGIRDRAAEAGTGSCKPISTYTGECVCAYLSADCSVVYQTYCARGFCSIAQWSHWGATF